MKRAVSQLFLLFLLFIPNSVFSGWQDRKAEGWAWYEEKQKPQQIETQEQPKSSSQEIQQIRDELEEKLSKALISPTPENVLAYMQGQKKWMEKSTDFAKVWTQMLLSYPHLDNTVTSRPVSQYGLQFHNQALQQEKEKLIRSLSKDFGLFLFYEGEDPASLFFSRIVQELSKKYELNTVAVSLDGTYLKGFEHNKKDNGIAQTLGVDLAPALYLIHPKADVVIPVSFGLVAMDQIEENIILQFKDYMLAEND